MSMEGARAIVSSSFLLLRSPDAANRCAFCAPCMQKIPNSSDLYLAKSLRVQPVVQTVGSDIGALQNCLTNSYFVGNLVFKLSSC